MDGDIISIYSLDMALDDGVLVELFDNRCFSSHPPKRLVMTASITRQFDHPGLQRIWDAYLAWLTTVHLLPEEEQLFSQEFDGQTVWVMEDGVSIVMMLPEDY